MVLVRDRIKFYLVYKFCRDYTQRLVLFTTEQNGGKNIVCVVNNSFFVVRVKALAFSLSYKYLRIHYAVVVDFF